MSLTRYLDAERDAMRLAAVPRLRAPGPIEPEPEPEASLPWEAKRDRFGKPLSPREVELLEAIRDGAINKQAAVILGCTEQTIKNHMSSILSKLDATDRTHAIVKAIQNGVISLRAGDKAVAVGLSPMMLQAWCDDLDQRLATIDGYVGWLRGRVAEVRSEAAAIVVPKGRPARPLVERIPGICSVAGCEAPVAAKHAGRGRPPMRCETHVVRRSERAA